MMTEVHKSYFNQSFSLLWDYHERKWVLSFYTKDGDEKGFEVSEQELEELVDLFEKVSENV